MQKASICSFLNNDVTVITRAGSRKCLVSVREEKSGAVGVKLIYPDNTIQHAGCVIGIGGIAGHMFVDMPANRTDIFTRLRFFRI